MKFELPNFTFSLVGPSAINSVVNIQHLRTFLDCSWNERMTDPTVVKSLRVVCLRRAIPIPTGGL